MTGASASRGAFGRAELDRAKRRQAAHNAAFVATLERHGFPGGRYPIDLARGDEWNRVAQLARKAGERAALGFDAAHSPPARPPAPRQSGRAKPPGRQAPAATPRRAKASRAVPDFSHLDRARLDGAVARNDAAAGWDQAFRAARGLPPAPESRPAPGSTAAGWDRALRAAMGVYDP